MIYTFALIHDEPIEFWAETGTSRDNYFCHLNDRKRLARLFGRRKLNVGLLRTCKQINEEAARVFYQNDFRFSAINGCIAASAFLYTIRPLNVHWLTSLTIAMPFISRNKTIFASAGNAETWSRVSDVVRGCARPGFKYPNTKSGRKWWTYAESFCLLAWNLAQHATHFKHLTFVHLEEFQVLSYLGNVENRKIWSAIEDLVVARPKMDVTVVHLEHPDSFKEMDESSVVMLQCLEAIVPLTHRVAYFDIKGRWELEPKYADEDGDK